MLTSKTTNVKSFRSLMLILGALTLFASGVLYAWSILREPFENFDSAALQLNYTISLCAFGFGGLFSGLLSKKISLKIRVIAGALLAGLGFTLATFTSGNILVLYLSYGLFSGLGIGIIYNSVIGSVNSWFPDKKGFSAGVLMMSFGFSTLIIGKLASALFSSKAFGWQKTYYLLAAFIVLSAIVFTLIAKMPSAQDLAGLPAPAKKASSAEGQDFTASQMVKRLTFWKLFIFFMLFTAVGSTIIGLSKAYCIDGLGVSKDLAVTIVGIVSVCNGLGRLLSGELFDRLGLKITQYLTSAIVILATAISLIGLLTSSQIIGIIGICLCGLSYGFSPTVSAAFIAAFYGMKNYPTNVSIINLVLIPASFMSTIAGGIESYPVIFAVLLGCSLVGLVINLTIKKP